MKHPRARSWFRLTVHDDEDGEGGDGGAGDGGEDEGGEGGGGSTSTFTQADLDRIVQERLARERQKYADYDELKTKAQKFEQIEAEQQSDLEKAQAEADRLKQENAQLKESAAGARRRAALERAAAKAKFHDPADAAVQIDQTLLEVDDDGNVTNADDLVATLAETKPYLVAAGDGGSNGSGSGGGTGSGSADGGAKEQGGDAKDFSKASRDEFATELSKYGLRPRS